MPGDMLGDGFILYHCLASQSTALQAETVSFITHFPVTIPEVEQYTESQMLISTLKR